MENPYNFRYCPTCQKNVMPAPAPQTGGTPVPKPIDVGKEELYCPYCGYNFTTMSHGNTRLKQKS